MIIACHVLYFTLKSLLHKTVYPVLLCFQDRPEILKLIKQVPDVIAGSVDPMGVQVVEGGVIAITLEGCDGGPLDQDHHLARLDATGGRPP